MIRLTLLLLAAIAITMVLAGREPEMRTEAGPTTPPVEVARAETDPTALDDSRLALNDEAGAIARALAATAEAHAPEPQKASLETPPAPPPAAMPDEAAWYVTGSRVNLRAGPSTATPVVGQARQGQRAEVLDATPDGWMHIRLTDSGTTAYIFGRFLSETPAG